MLFTAVASDERCCFVPSDQELVHVYLKHIYGLWPSKHNILSLSVHPVLQLKAFLMTSVEAANYGP